MSRIFISYRRSDSISESGRIHDHLEREFGGRNVFKDVDDIQPGYDFRKVLEEEVSQCDVLLAIIGQRWVNASDADGNLRLQNPDDFVRIEVESGLKRGDEVLVIPVLINNATMPNIRDLPESLHELTYRNAVIIRNDPDFNRDMRRLIDYIYRYRKQNRPNRMPQFVAGGVLALIALVIILLIVNPQPSPEPEIISTEPNSPTMTVSEPKPTGDITDADLANELYQSAQGYAGNANYPEAINAYTAAIDANPQLASAYLGRALAHSSGYGDFVSAIADLEQAISLDPNYGEAFSYLGQFSYFDENYEDVEPNLLRAIELNPSDVEARNILAEYYTSVGKYTSAYDQYILILEQKDNLDLDKVYNAWLGAGYTQEAQGNFDDAIPAYESAIALEPNLAEAYARIGNMLVHQEDYQGALGYLDTAYDKASDNPDVISNRGLAHLGLDNQTQALADFDRALQLAPNNISAYIGRGRVNTVMGNYVSAIADFNQAIVRDDDKQAYYWRGRVHYDEGNYESAIEDFTEAINEDAYTTESFAYRGLAYAIIDEPELAVDDLNTALDYGIEGDMQYDVLVELGWLELGEMADVSALNYFAEAVALDSSNSRAYEGQAAVFITRANVAEEDNEAVNHLISALDVLTRANDEIPDNVFLLVKRAEVYLMLGDLTEDDQQYQRAMMDLEIAASLDDEYSPAWELMARVALVMQNAGAETALSLAQEAYDLDDSDPDILGLLAEIHEELDDVDEALRFYQLAVDNSDNDEERDFYQSEVNRLLSPVDVIPTRDNG